MDCVFVLDLSHRLEIVIIVRQVNLAPRVGSWIVTEADRWRDRLTAGAASRPAPADAACVDLAELDRERLEWLQPRLAHAATRSTASSHTACQCRWYHASHPLEILRPQHTGETRL